MIVYRLTNQQRKQLLVRSVPLRIVIPSPGEELSDAEADRYARAALTDARRYVTIAYQTDIVCRPAGGDGLAGVLGQILPDQSTPPDDDLVIWLAVESGSPRGAANEEEFQESR